MASIRKPLGLAGRIKRQSFPSSGMERQVSDQLGHTDLVRHVSVRRELMQLMGRFLQAVSSPRFTSMTEDARTRMPFNRNHDLPFRIVSDLN